jgi:predicted Fe-Mo cluster-binding NifX family protein
MRVCVPVTADGQVGSGWGRAARVAVADVVGGDIVNWQEFDVAWDALHDAGTEGSHHARVATFVRDQGVEAVAAGHMGPPMQNMLSKMGVRVVLSAAGDARAAVRAVEG